MVNKQHSSNNSASNYLQVKEASQTRDVTFVHMYSDWYVGQ